MSGRLGQVSTGSDRDAATASAAHPYTYRGGGYGVDDRLPGNEAGWRAVYG